MQTLWPVPVTDLAGADLTNVTLNYLRDKTVPTYYDWNFNIQRELPRNVLLQVGYVGNKGLNLPNRYDANQAAPFDPLNPLPIPARRPYKTLGFISANSSSTYSNYNGLDVHVERRDRKSTRLNSSHRCISYAVVCLKKKKKKKKVNNLEDSNTERQRILAYRNRETTMRER